MSKPTSKAESKWLFWRTENPRHTTKKKRGFGKWAKNMMNRAKRRQYKKEQQEE